MKKFGIASASLVLALSSFAFADGSSTPVGCSADQLAQNVTTTHSVTIGGKAVNYTATVGFLEITLNVGDFAGAWQNVGVAPAPIPATPPKACIFSTYYQALAPAGTSQADFTRTRPLTFAFNGGPGSASLWLHLGLMGPRRVVTGPAGLTPTIPFQLEDNADSPLDLTDIVMIDPVGTGFSHASGGADISAFLGVQYDAESVATFIRTFQDQNGREDSPLYVLGESYGGIRGPIVTQLLQQALSRPVNGLVLVSPCLSSMVFEFGTDDMDTPYWTFFPTMAAIAHYHGRTDAKFAGLTADQVFNLATTFAQSQYREALEMGNQLLPTDQHFHDVAAQMHEFLGVSQADIEGWFLRVNDTDFFSYVLSDTGTGLEVGRYDGRYTGYKLVTETGADADDPSSTAQSFVFAPAIDYYLRGELGVKTTSPYVDMANLPMWPWNADAQEYVSTRNLSIAFADNPQLKVFVASGYYDMACPMGTVEYERTRLDPTTGGASRMFLHRYEGGHMMYTNPVALHQLKQDLNGFYLPSGI